MSSREIEALLAELSELLDTGSPSELTSFLLRRLRLAVAEPVLAQLPEPLERSFPLTTPVTDWLGFESGARFSLLERAAEAKRREQWSDRHALQTIATLRAGVRAPRGWAPRPLEDALASVEPWDRMVACAEILERQSDTLEHRCAVVRLLDDASVEVRRWAWLAVVRWVELGADDALGGAIRGGLSRADPELMPRIAWAAMHAELADEALTALAPSLDASELARIEALQVIRWLRRCDDAVRTRIEARIDDASHDVCLAAMRALGAVAPQRWQRLWDLRAETEQSRERIVRRRGRSETIPAREVPTARACVAIDALTDAAPALGDDAVATIVAHAAEPQLVRLVGALGPRARGAVPALIARVEREVDLGTAVMPPELEALARIGGPDALALLERAARLRDGWHATYLAMLGAEAIPAFERLLDDDLTEKIRCRVLEAVASLGAHAEPLRARLLAHLEHASPDVPAWACTALASMAVDDLLAVRLATVFLRCAEQVPPFARDYHHAARVLAPIWAARIEHPSEIVRGAASERSAPHASTVALTCPRCVRSRPRATVPSAAPRAKQPSASSTPSRCSARTNDSMRPSGASRAERAAGTAEVRARPGLGPELPPPHPRARNVSQPTARRPACSRRAG